MSSFYNDLVHQAQSEASVKSIERLTMKQYKNPLKVDGIKQEAIEDELNITADFYNPSLKNINQLKKMQKDAPNQAYCE